MPEYNLYTTTNKYGHPIPRPTIEIPYWEEDDQGEWENAAELEFDKAGLLCHGVLVPWEEIDRLRGIVESEK